jgi:hypothetical protein
MEESQCSPHCLLAELRLRRPLHMRGYVEEGGVWNDNAAHRLGLLIKTRRWDSFP